VSAGARTADATTRRWTKGDVVDDRATHPLMFAELDERLGPFTVDVAARAQHEVRAVLRPRRRRPGAVVGRRDGVVQPAVLRHRAVDPEGLGVLSTSTPPGS
jgi:hypothetical protein